MRTKRAALEQALTGRVRAHHRYLLAQQLVHLDFLDEQVADLEQQITHLIADEPPTDGPTSRNEGAARGARGGRGCRGAGAIAA